MADPFTWAAIGMGATAIGGGITAYGQSQSGAAAQQAYAYKAGIAQMNSQIAARNSDYTIEATGRNVERQGIQTGQTVGQAKVAQAEGGFDVNAGTNAGVRDTIRSVGQIDADTIRRTGDIKALNFRNQAAGYTAEATGDVMAGDAAKTAGDISALGTLVGTAGSVASKWSTANTQFGKSGITTFGPEQNVTGWFPSA